MDETTKAVAATVIIIFALACGIFALTTCGEAAEVAREEAGPRAMRDKYRWFKQQHERISKARQDITTFEKSVDGVKAKYEVYGEPKDWAPSISHQYNTELERATVDLKAIVSNHDNMVRDYNAASADFMWEKFDTEGDLPRNHNRYAPK